MSPSRKKVSVIIALVLAGEVIFFLPFVLARVFRPTLLQVFDITNLELGTYFSLYGVVAMVSYFFGGPLADRFPARNLMAYALWMTSLGGFAMATVPEPQTLKYLYIFWGFTTIFLFWAALIKSTRAWGGDAFQGRAFGFLEGGRGLTAALIGTLAVAIFASGLSGGSDVIQEADRTGSFRLVILITSAIVFIAGMLIWYVVPRVAIKNEVVGQTMTVKNVLKLFKMPVIWMQAIIILCAYVGYKITDDLSLYANEVLGFDEVSSAGVGTAALWLRPVFAISAGLLADRIGGTKIIIACFLVMIGGGLLIYTGTFSTLIIITLIILAGTVAGVYGLRGIYFAVMQQSKIPLALTGTAVGIMSVAGYTPDVFMSPLMGFLLDNYPGETGHRYVFLTLVIFATIGLAVSYVFHRFITKE
jgi:MFS transporter, GlpU family, inner membrane protein